MMILVTGGSASGKSAWAEDRLLELGGRRIYAATMIPWDEECRKRIRKHRAMRAGKGFETVECPLDLHRRKELEGKDVLLECLSNLTANEIFRQDAGQQEEPDPEKRILQGLIRLKEKARNLVVVTGEVFSDGEIYPEETETYRKVLGRLNQAAAAMADEAVEVVCGIPVRLK